MATCKDCLHAEVCWYKAFNDTRLLQKRSNNVEKFCKSFAEEKHDINNIEKRKED